MGGDEQSHQSSTRRPQPGWLDSSSASEIDFSLGNDSSQVRARGVSQSVSASHLQQLESTELYNMIPTSSFIQDDFDFLNTPKQSRHQDACTSTGELETLDSWALSAECFLNGLVMLLDRCRSVASASKALHHILGFDMQDILGVAIYDILHPDDKARFRSSISILLSTEYPVLCRYRLRNVEGGYIDFVSVCQVLARHSTSVLHDVENSDRHTILIISQVRTTDHSLTRQLRTQNHQIHSLQQRIIDIETNKQEVGSHIPNPVDESSRAIKHSIVGDHVRSDQGRADWSYDNLHPDLRPLAINSRQVSEQTMMEREIALAQDFDRAGFAETNRTSGRRRMSSSGRGRAKIETHMCYACGTNDTPEWRKGPKGPKTLCNACGLKWSKKNNRDNKSLVSY